MEIKEHKYSFKEKVKNTFYPERCPYCTRVIPLGELCCDECAKQFTDITYHTYAKGGYLTVSAVPYTGIFAQGIIRFKKEHQYAYQLARIMAEAIINEYRNETFDLITYVPLHPKKHEERGYNQSELLAQELSQLLSIPVEATLKKTRNNQPQHSLKNASEREKNVKGAYRLTSKTSAKGKNILLIDDIITTGNTLGECARVLCCGNAQNVLCATFAIAVAKTT